MKGDLQMGKIKGALLFMSGLAIGIGYFGGSVATYALKDEDFSKCVKYKVHKKVNKLLGTVLRPEKRYEIHNNPITKTFSVIFVDRNYAEKFKNAVEDMIDTYGLITLYDIKILLNESSQYMDDKWGWFDRKHIRMESNFRGYEVVFSSASHIE